MVRIVANPGILGGKPIVEGTRLTSNIYWGYWQVVCPVRRLLQTIQI